MIIFLIPQPALLLAKHHALAARSCQEVNPFLPEFIIPAEPLNAEDKMAAPGRYPKWARNATSSAFVQPKR